MTKDQCDVPVYNVEAYLPKMYLKFSQANFTDF